MPSAAPPRVGIKLRRARIERSLSIEETAWRTRIRPDLLRALEGDEFETVGHPATVKTHLSSYARFLGVDPADVLDGFDALHEHLPSPVEELERQVQQAQKPPRARWFLAAALCAAVLAAAAVLGVLGGQGDRSQSALPPAVPSRGPLLAAEARVTLSVRALATTTVSVLADGRQVFEGDFAAGDAKTFRARRSVELMVADGGAVRLALNGRSIGVAGERGSVYRARFGPNGRLDG